MGTIAPAPPTSPAPPAPATCGGDGKASTWAGIVVGYHRDAVLIAGRQAGGDRVETPGAPRSAGAGGEEMSTREGLLADELA